MAKNPKTGPKTAGASWWLEAGEVDCPHCEQAYSYEVEVRCYDCDEPICPMCIVQVDEHVFCPDCREAE
jgi:hypothetical protein